MKTWNERLKDLREMRGLTQEELSKKAKVSQSQVCAYEKGTRFFNEKTLKKILAALKVDYDSLFANKEQSKEVAGIVLHRDIFVDFPFMENVIDCLRRRDVDGLESGLVYALRKVRKIQDQAEEEKEETRLSLQRGAEEKKPRKAA